MLPTTLRHALRVLAAQPLTSLTATIALTVGIAVATVGFATMEALVFSHLPWDAGRRWVQVQTLTARDRQPVRLQAADYARLATLDGLTHLGGLSTTRSSVAIGPRRDDLLTAGLTPSSWPHLPVAPLSGRLLLPSDAAPGQPAVALLSERYLRRTAAAITVGDVITIGDTPHTIVGILPGDFEFPSAPDLWLPIDERFLAGAHTPGSDVRLFGILDAELTPPAMQPRLDALAGDLRAADPQEAAVIVMTGFTDLGPMATSLSAVIVVVVASVLLVIAANVGNLVLARSFGRAREFAVRAALGASRATLIAHVALEILLIGVVAAGFGFLGAQAILRRFNAMDDLPFWADFTGGPLTAALVALATLMATLVAGAWPALRATRRDLTDALRGGDGRASDVRFGRVSGAMVVVQIAVSVVMLHGALVVAQGFRAYTTTTITLPDNVITTGVTADLARTATPSIAALPGVLSVGLTTALPRHSPPLQRIEIDGVAGQVSAPSAGVNETYFDALGTALRAGRAFTEADRHPSAPPAAIVNEPFVRQHLAGASPIGRRFRVIADGGPGPWMDIVGVVPDLGLSIGNPDFAAGFYTPLRSDTDVVYLAARVQGEPLAFVEPIRETLRQHDAEAVPFRFVRLQDVAADDRAFFAGFSQALLGLGAVTLGLALVGVYSMMSLIVTRRTREIGIRLALGASSRRIVGTIAGRAGAQVALGGLLGGLLATASLGLRDVLVSRLGDGGAWTLPIVVSLLALAAVAAVWIPVQRALRVRPQESLRAQ